MTNPLTRPKRIKENRNPTKKNESEKKDSIDDDETSDPANIMRKDNTKRRNMKVMKRKDNTL